MADGVARVLEMMHPMREPPQPASLAPFAITFAIGCAAALALLALVFFARRRRSDLRRAAVATLARTRGLVPEERLAAQASLLRRLVRRLAGEAEAKTQGADWLATLDGTFETRFFTQGAGAAYGDALYGPRVPDVDALDAALTAMFAKLGGGTATWIEPQRRRAHPPPQSGGGGTAEGGGGGCRASLLVPYGWSPTNRIEAAAAPSTMLRLVPLPRFAEEEPRVWRAAKRR